MKLAWLWHLVAHANLWTYESGPGQTGWMHTSTLLPALSTGLLLLLLLLCNVTYDYTQTNSIADFHSRLIPTSIVAFIRSSRNEWPFSATIAVLSPYIYVTCLAMIVRSVTTWVDTYSGSISALLTMPGSKGVCTLRLVSIALTQQKMSFLYTLEGECTCAVYRASWE